MSVGIDRNASNIGMLLSASDWTKTSKELTLSTFGGVSLGRQGDLTSMLLREEQASRFLYSYVRRYVGVIAAGMRQPRTSRQNLASRSMLDIVTSKLVLRSNGTRRVDNRLMARGRERAFFHRNPTMFVLPHGLKTKCKPWASNFAPSHPRLVGSRH